jgi:uncharacterized protein YecE (DUF72 family)
VVARCWIGVSGWAYRSWRGKFYPEDLPSRRYLEYASRRFHSLEINGSFYSLQRPRTYRRWYEVTPRGFRFAVKGHRFVTHNKKLGDVEQPLANFFASGVLLLREKLGPIVWQLSPRLSFDEARCDRFFRLLPRDTRAAARLARRHNRRLGGGSWTRTGRPRPLRYAIEVRHESFFRPEAVRLARRHGVAVVVSHSGDWPLREELTAGFVYVRLHGAPRTYASGYGAKALDRWAARIRRWHAGGEPRDAARVTDLAPPRRRARDVYVYFDNDQRAHAPRNALGLLERVRRGQGAGPTSLTSPRRWRPEPRGETRRAAP